MEIRKYFWALRFLVYKLFFGKSGKIGYLGKPLIIKNAKNIFLGERVRIYPGARLECHDGGSIIIEDNVSIGQNVHITSGKEPLIIKSGTSITGNVFITNITHLYTDIEKSVANQSYIVETTIIGSDCFIGYSSGLLPGTQLGKHCIVGAHSLVMGKYDDYSVIVGNPPKVVKKYNFNEMRWERHDD